MRSKPSRAVLLGLCACLLYGGCTVPNGNSPETGPATEETDMSDTMSETNRMTETETEGQEGYIPHAKQVDFSRFDEEMLKKTFPNSVATDVSLCAEGVLMTARSKSNDPQVTFNISDMYRAAGYEQTATGSCVPRRPRGCQDHCA